MNVNKKEKKRIENNEKIDNMKRTYNKGDRPFTAHRSVKKV